MVKYMRKDAKRTKMTQSESSRTKVQLPKRWPDKQIKKLSLPNTNWWHFGMMECEEWRKDVKKWKIKVKGPNCRNWKINSTMRSHGRKVVRPQEVIQGLKIKKDDNHAAARIKIMRSHGTNSARKFSFLIRLKRLW